MTEQQCGAEAIRTDDGTRVSRAVSAQYDVGCPVCSAGPNEPCRTRTTGRVTDTHLWRRDEWHVRHGLFARPPMEQR